MSRESEERIVCVCVCMHLYLCYSTCGCVSLQTYADLTASVPDQNTPSSCWTCPVLIATGKVLKCLEGQLSSSALLPNWIQVFKGSLLPFRHTTRQLASNEPKASENLTTDFAKLNSIHEVCESHY